MRSANDWPRKEPELSSITGRPKRLPGKWSLRSANDWPRKEPELSSITGRPKRLPGKWSLRSSAEVVKPSTADVQQEDQVRAMVACVGERWGRLDILVNNAGWSRLTPHWKLEELTDEIWDRTLNTNLRGAFYCCRAAVPLMREHGGGAIVNNTSASAYSAAGSSIVYSASKAAMVNMTKSLARALAPDIRVNAIAPGLVHTRFAGWPDEAFADGRETSPLKRIASVEDVAATVLFLVSDASAITAETILIDCGATMLATSRPGR